MFKLTLRSTTQGHSCHDADEVFSIHHASGLPKKDHTKIFRIAAILLSNICLPSLCIATNETEPKAKPLQQPVVMSGYPSTVRVQSCLYGCRQSYAIFSVLVQARAGNTVPEIFIQTTGLGEAVLTNEGSSNSCPSSVSSGSGQLTLAGVTTKATRVCVFVPLSLLPEADMSLKGNVVVLVPHSEPLIAAVDLHRGPQPPATTAFLWFLGFAIPAMATFWLNYRAARLTETRARLRAEREAFDADKEGKRQDYTYYFENYLPGLRQRSNAEFVRLAYKELVRQGSWTRIPWEDRNRLYRYVLQDPVMDVQLAEFKRLLCSLFPEWQEQIVKLGSGS